MKRKRKVNNDRLRPFHFPCNSGPNDLIDCVSSVSEWVFMGELMNDRLVMEQEHLTCFMPGLLALGGWHGLRHAALSAANNPGTTINQAELKLTETVRTAVAYHQLTFLIMKAHLYPSRRKFISL
jgi:hypothetical protein